MNVELFLWKGWRAPIAAIDKGSPDSYRVVPATKPHRNEELFLCFDFIELCF